MAEPAAIPFVERDLPNLPQFQLLLTDLLPQIGKPTISLGVGDAETALLELLHEESTEGAMRISKLIGDIGTLKAMAADCDHSKLSDSTIASVGYGLTMLVDVHQALIRVSQHCEVGQ